MMRVLLVDDEPMALRALERLLKKARPECEVVPVSSGDSALAKLDSEPFDVIITDLQMPVTSGLAVLTHVKDFYPHMVRVVLSGSAEQDARLETVQLAHQYLAKPCTLKELEETLARAASLRRLMTNESVRTAVAAVDTLPSAPRVYASLSKALQHSESSIQDVSAIVMQDSAMAARVLQVVNSAFFGLPQHVTSVAEAVAFIGMNTLRSLVLTVEAFRVFGDSDRCEGFSIERHQAHGLLTARIASRIVTGQIESDDAFTGGLLHDIGKLILASRLSTEFAPVLQRAERDQRPVHVIEGVLLGVTHATVGAALLEIWGLPHSIVAIVINHHSPDALPPGWGAAAAVNVADALAHEHAQEVGLEPRQAYPAVSSALLARLGMEASLDEFREIAAEEARRAMQMPN